MTSLGEQGWITTTDRLSIRTIHPFTVTREGDPMIPPPPRFPLSVPHVTFPTRREHEPATASGWSASGDGVGPGGGGATGGGRAADHYREDQRQHRLVGGAHGAPRDRQGVRRPHRGVSREERAVQEGRGPAERPRHRGEDPRADQGSGHGREMTGGRGGEGFSLVE